MRKRLVWLAAALVCLMLVGLLAGWFVQPGFQIDKLAIEQIKIGMTENEVVRLVGMPPGEYRTAAEQDERSRFDKSTWWMTSCAEGSGLTVDDSDRLVRTGNPADAGLCPPPDRTGLQWRTNLQVLYLVLDDRRIVTGFYFHSLGKHEDTAFQKLRRWLAF